MCLSGRKAEYPQRRTAMLSSWANVPAAQWPTVTLDKDTDSTNITCIMNMNLVWRCTHMFHPPPHPLPPEEQQLNSPFFFSETLNLKNFHLFAFIIRHCRATGCLFSSSPPPTYSMGWCTYPACAGYTNYHWQQRLANTDWKQNKGSAFSVKSCLLAVMRIRQSDVTQCYSPVRNSSALCQLQHLYDQVQAAASYICIKTHVKLINFIWCDTFLHMVLFFINNDCELVILN